MRYLRALLDWYNVQNDMAQFFLTICFVVLLVWTVRKIYQILTKIFWLALPKKMQKLKEKNMSDAELAIRERGILPEGLSVFVFNTETGELIEERKDRHLSSREIGEDPLVQIRALTLAHAKFKFDQLRKTNDDDRDRGTTAETLGK